VEHGEDWLVVNGIGGTEDVITGGTTINSSLDHRIAMSFLVLGLGAQTPITVDDASPIDTSFPGFCNLMGSLGVQFHSTGEHTQ
jgi:3-phosphoshikimate 1-carboxyvinyltransferase